MKNCVSEDISSAAKRVLLTQIKLILRRSLSLYLVAVVCLILSGTTLQGQERISTPVYIETYKDIAIKKMNEFSIPASITLAQGILESGSGNSRLATKANNHFGIKCHKGWTGKTFTMDDDAKDECFRKYKDPADSYRDHSEFLTQRGRYTFLFEYEITDYESWAKGLKKAGYATNPKYPELLIRLIEKYDLSQYDKGSGKKKKKRDKGKEIAVEASTLSLTSLTSNKTPVYTSNDGRDVYENNEVRFVVGKAGDTYYDIAADVNIFSWQLFKYNEREKDHIIKSGEIVYLEKKKKKSEKQYKIHLVQKGETLRYVSDLYGVKLSSLRKRNSISEEWEVNQGDQVKLR